MEGIDEQAGDVMPTPYDESFIINVVRPDLVSDYAEANKPLDANYLVWGTRTERDVVEQGLTYKQSWRKHRDEERVANGLPPINPPEPVPTIVPLHVTPGRPLFLKPDNSIYRLRGVTAFTAPDDFARNRLDQLNTYDAWTTSIGADVWRTFGIWSRTDFDPRRVPNYYGILRSFANWMGEHGKHLWYVAFTDQTSEFPSVHMSDAEQDDHVGRAADALRGLPNVFWEFVNEDWKNGLIAARFSSATVNGLLATRSAWPDIQGVTPSYPGSLLQFTNEHTPRDAQWMRKAKNLGETCRGQAMSAPWPATGLPAVAGEEIGLFKDAIAGARSNSPRAFADYAALCELFGAGFILHGDWSQLQRCIVPSHPTELAIVAAVKEVWQNGGIPLDAVTGQYTRGGLGDCPIPHTDRYDDDGNEVNKAGALRTFFMIQDNVATGVIVDPGQNWTLGSPFAPWRLERRTGPHQQIVHLQR